MSDKTYEQNVHINSLLPKADFPDVAGQSSHNGVAYYTFRRIGISFNHPCSLTNKILKL